MEVVSINVKQDDRRKEDMLEVLDVLRDKVESGEIKEFVAASIDPDGVASGFAYILNQVKVDHTVLSRAFKNELRTSIVAGNQDAVEEWFENDKNSSIYEE